MASIIKVDTIQTAAGGTPTAADLGLNTTGSIINTHQFDVSSTSSSTVGNWVTASTGTVTPTSASSKFILMPTLHCRVGNGAESRKQMGVRLVRNGSTVINNTAGSVESLHLLSSVNFSELDGTVARTYIDSPNSTSDVTYTVQFVRGSLGNTAYVFPSSFGSSFVVLEIAG